MNVQKCKIHQGKKEGNQSLNAMSSQQSASAIAKDDRARIENGSNLNLHQNDIEM